MSEKSWQRWRRALRKRCAGKASGHVLLASHQLCILSCKIKSRGGGELVRPGKPRVASLNIEGEEKRLFPGFVVFNIKSILSRSLRPFVPPSTETADTWQPSEMESMFTASMVVDTTPDGQMFS